MPFFVQTLSELPTVAPDCQILLRMTVPGWLEPGRVMERKDADRLLKLDTWRDIYDAQKRMTLLEAKQWICLELMRPKPRPKFIKRLWQACQTLRKHDEITALAKLFPKLKARAWVHGA